MAKPIRDSANDNQLCRPSVGDSRRATAADFLSRSTATAALSGASDDQVEKAEQPAS